MQQQLKGKFYGAGVSLESPGGTDESTECSGRSNHVRWIKERSVQGKFKSLRYRIESRRKQ